MMAPKAFNLLSYSPSAKELLEGSGSEEYIENILESYSSLADTIKTVEEGEFSSKKLYNQYFSNLESEVDLRGLNQVIDYAQRQGFVAVNVDRIDKRFTIVDADSERIEKTKDELELIEASRQLENGLEEDHIKTYLKHLRDQKPRVYNDIREYGSDIASEQLHRIGIDQDSFGRPWESIGDHQAYQNSVMALEDLGILSYSAGDLDIDESDVRLFKDVLKSQQAIVLDSRESNIESLQTMFSDYM